MFHNKLSFVWGFTCLQGLDKGKTRLPSCFQFTLMILEYFMHTSGCYSIEINNQDRKTLIQMDFVKVFVDMPIIPCSCVITPTVFNLIGPLNTMRAKYIFCQSLNNSISRLHKTTCITICYDIAGNEIEVSKIIEYFGVLFSKMSDLFKENYVTKCLLLVASLVSPLNFTTFTIRLNIFYFINIQTDWTQVITTLNSPFSNISTDYINVTMVDAILFTAYTYTPPYHFPPIPWHRGC